MAARTREAVMEMFILSLPDQVLLESSEQGVERKQDFSDFSSSLSCFWWLPPPPPPGALTSLAQPFETGLGTQAA